LVEEMTLTEFFNFHAELKNWLPSITIKKILSKSDSWFKKGQDFLNTKHKVWRLKIIYLNQQATDLHQPGK